MVDVYFDGDNKGTVVVVKDKSTAYIDNRDTVIVPDNEPTVPVKGDEISLGEKTKWKLIECIITFFFGALSGLATAIPNIDPLLSLLFILVTIVIFVFVCSAFADLFRIRYLKKIGSFVELQSKINLLDSIVGVFKKETSEHKVRTGALYLNYDGTIYHLTGDRCPICKKDPGTMYFIRDKKTGIYSLVCSAQPALHRMVFDYKTFTL